MTIYGKIKFKDAIIVDEKLLCELEEIILTFYKEINYSCILSSDDSIDFESLEELLNYENTKMRKIERLKISFGHFNEIVFKPTISAFCSYKYTVEGTFKTEDNNNSILFPKKIQDALEKNKQSKWYTIITKISLMHFMSLLFGASIGSSVSLLYTKGINISQETGYIPSIVNLGIAFGILCILFAIIFSKCRNILLPPIAFKIGEQIKEIEKGRDLFSKIVWGVVVAFLISLFAGLLI